MRQRLAFLALILGSALAGCGGGGVSSTPTPTPSPAPTPTPTPANTTLTDLRFDQNFAARAAQNPYTIDATGAGAPGTGSGNGDIQLRYNAAARSYTVSTGSRADATFAAADRNAAQSNATISVYEKTIGGVSHNLVLFNPGAANPVLALTYASYGAWQTILPAQDKFNVNTTYLVFGINTAAADMPRTGSATYRTNVDGTFAGSTGVYSLGGNSSFSANFAAGTIAFSVTPVGSNILNGSAKTFGTISGTGTITGGTSAFTGTAGANGNGYSMGLIGDFFGPAAAEMGGTFLLQGPDGRGSGAMVGRKN